MGSIANRPIIMIQLWHNYENLVQKIEQHFNDTKVKMNYFVIEIGNNKNNKVQRLID